MNKRDDGTGGGGGGGRARADATKDLYRNLSGLGLKSVTSSQLANLAYIKFVLVPPELVELAKVEVLDLSHNQVKGVPSWISRLTELRILLLGHNQITTVDGSWAGPQSKLRVVNLQHNLLTAGSLVGAVRNPLRLNALSLASNSLTSMPTWITEFCLTLERLYLDGNAIAELPENLPALRSLRYLALDSNQLRHIQPATLLPNLIGLGVASNRINVKPDFQQSIQVLRIDGNPWLQADDGNDAATAS